MKRFLILSLLGVLLGGCVIVPLDTVPAATVTTRGDGYYHGDGYFRRDGNRGYGYRDHGG
jgi:hypothetical protein